MLYWIHGSKKLPPFVSHCVTEIKQLFHSAFWGYYCPTNDNSADLLTRGITFKQFKSAVSWTRSTALACVQHSSISHLHAVAAITDEFIPTEQAPFNMGLHCIIKVTDYSTLPRLLLITAFVYRFMFNLCHPQEQQISPIKAFEPHYVRKQWIKDCQNQVYWREISNLSSSS